MKKLCIYGCGGMGREIADLAYILNRWSEIFFIDDNIKTDIVNEIPIMNPENKTDKTEKIS